MWKRVHEAFEQEDIVDLGVAIELTDVLEPARAREVFAAARQEPGWCALVVAEDAQLTPGDLDAAERVKEWLARYDESPDPFTELHDGASIDAALARLGEITGGDPLRVLHRLDGETIMAIEGDDEVELDEEFLLPDDPREAYEAALAAREESRQRAREMPSFGLVLEPPSSIRPHDVATAIAQMSPGRSRVVRLATTPARALLYLGVGGWNDCPNPWEQARIWEHWARTIGAEPTMIGAATVEGIVTRPITTRESLVQHAREAVTYDRDTVMEGWLPLLSMLWRSSTLSFWWD